MFLLTTSYKSSAYTVNQSQILHTINRLSFGIAPSDIQEITATGIKAYTQSQLSPTSITETETFLKKLNQLSTLKMTPVEIYKTFNSKNAQTGQQVDQLKGKILEEAIEARLLRAINSRRQLNEVMVNLWFNHFNVFRNKGQLVQMLIGSYEQQAIRPHVFGRFRDLLEATARHPAMLLYLDNWLNTDPKSPKAKGKFKGLNENYARELMELHTLGVDGGYTQKDVITLAQILTGWGTNAQGFYFARDRHDKSDKVFLGIPIKGGGEEEVEKALDILASHPSTAHHISYKLAQYFLADQPPNNVVSALAQKFTETDGNIKAVLETLFNHPEFSNPKYYNNKFKTPYEYITSIVRTAPIKDPDLKAIADILKQLGMPVYGCISPDGYKNTESAWLSPDAVIRRVSIASDIANGNLLTTNPLNSNQLSQIILSEKSKKVIKNSSSDLRAALILGSPEMMKR